MPPDPLAGYTNHDVADDPLTADDERLDLHDPNDPDDPLAGPETIDTSLDDMAGTPAPAAPAPPETPAAPASGDSSDGTADPVAPAGTETPAGDAQPAVSAEERRWAGRFETPEQLETAYTQAQQHMMSAAERANAAERRLAETNAAVQRYLESERARQQPPAQPPQPQPVPEPTDAELIALGFESREQYRAVAQRVQAELDQRYAPALQQMSESQRQLAQRMQNEEVARAQQSQEAQAREAQAEATRVLSTFRTAHPEFAPGTPREAALAGTIQRFNAAWTGDPTGAAEGSFEVTADGALEIAAEALDNPALARVLEVNPHYIDTDAGMELARHQATLIQASSRAATTQPAGNPTAPASPHVESGATGTIPGSSGASRDEFDAVLELDKTMRERSHLGS